MSAYTSLIRPLLFRLPPETAHSLVTQGVLKPVQRIGPVRSVLRSQYQYRHPALRTEVFGIEFPTPVGMAAGFDKNGEVVPVLADLGFGFVHAGTVTPRPQLGNPRPRMFRLPEDRGLINRLGLPNQGADRVRERFESTDFPDVPVAVHVDKMNDAGAEDAITHYREVMETLYEFPDYFVLGACPNTPDEFDRTDTEYLSEVFAEVDEANVDDKPVLVRLRASDPERRRETVELIESFGFDGVLIGTPQRPSGDLQSSERDERGHVTGPPIAEEATELVRECYRMTDLPVVGVGGVDSAEAAYEKIRAGASLVKLYTGFVYNGPSTAREICSGLVERLEADGFSSVEEAVGIDAEKESPRVRED